MSLLGFGPIAEAPLAAEATAGTTTNQTVSATLTTTASVVKQVGKPLGVITVATTVSLLKIAGKSVSATVTTAASLVKSAGKIVSPAISTSISFVRDIATGISLGLAFAVNIPFLTSITSRGFEQTLQDFVLEHRRKIEERDAVGIVRLRSAMLIKALKSWMDV